MFLELLRFVFFFMPLTFLNGLNCLIFDNVDIVGVAFDFKTRRKKQTRKLFEQKIIKDYLKKCFKESGGDYGVNDGEKKADK